ncbi:hypothetical protein Tco_0819890 [Tanacetum coccineum]|uniref:Uncharacterized protein n=1 Tax=Tanacetum coccineum TaxID=301880 RepID=A0ABQ5A8R0_9ASTR
MDDDLFTYDVEIPRLPTFPCDKKERDESNDSDLDIYEPRQWLDLIYGDHTKVDALKFYNHKTMDRYTKNALWIYWTRGDDEVELTDEEFSDPGDKNLIDKGEVAEIFRIETNIFDFETPICKATNSINF